MAYRKYWPIVIFIRYFFDYNSREIFVYPRFDKIRQIRAKKYSAQIEFFVKS